MEAVFQKGLVLLNVAHSQRRPRHPRAAFRLLACVPDMAAAQAKAQTFPTDADVVAIEMGKWAVLLANADNHELELPHLDRLWSKHRQRAKEHELEFETNRTERRVGMVCPTQPRIDDAENALPELPAGDASVGVQSWNRGLETRCQQFAIISLLPDYGESSTTAQPGLAVWAVTDSEASARALIKDTLSGTVRDVHLWVVSMYEWLAQPRIEELTQVPVEYRDPTLTDIMRAKSEQKKKICAFEEQCAQAGLPMPVIDLVPDLPRDPTKDAV